MAVPALVPDEEASRARLKVADTVGGLLEFWGFRRPMGRVWTLLYLSPSPLSAAEIAAQMHMSAGAVSLTLAELLKWGAVKKRWQPGKRRDHFEPETAIWKLVSRVLEERELRLVREVGQAFAAADGALSGREFEHRRLQQLRRMAQLGEGILAAIVAGEPIDPMQLRTLVQPREG